MRARLYGFYWWCQQRIAPGLRPSQFTFAETLAAELRDRPRWLDVGCGRRPLPVWVPERFAQAILGRAGWSVGVDLDLASLRDNTTLRRRVQSAADVLPFASNTFDVVSANMVMEHVEDPRLVLDEIRRVLRPGGVFVFHTPNRRHWAIATARVVPERIKTWLVGLLEARAAEDVFPTHYRFNDRDEIARAAAAAGFEVVRLEAVSSSAVLAPAGPAVIPELLWIRLMRRPTLSHWRSNLIGVLRAAPASDR
jgi:ubiquinone/menaquinone biosynthesis C-methylase UbiE